MQAAKKKSPAPKFRVITADSRYGNKNAYAESLTSFSAAHRLAAALLEMVSDWNGMSHPHVDGVWVRIETLNGTELEAERAAELIRKAVKAMGGEVVAQ